MDTESRKELWSILQVVGALYCCVIGTWAIVHPPTTQVPSSSSGSAPVSAPHIVWWFWILIVGFAICAVVMAVGLIVNLTSRPKLKNSVTEEAAKSEPKLKILRAVYGGGQGRDVDVTDKLRSLAQDAVVVPVDNNLIPYDPAIGTRKRLVVDYSYGDGTVHSAYRVESLPEEPNRLTLPEDPIIPRLTKELSHLQAKYASEKERLLNEKAQAENKTILSEKEQQSLLNRLSAIIHETLVFLREQGPVPDLNPGELGTEHGKVFAAEIEKRIHRVHGGFSLRLHPSIEKLTLELGEKGIFDYTLAQLMQQPAHSESNILDITQKLMALRDKLEVQEYGGESHDLTYSRISTAEIKEILSGKNS